jgi:murein DD-endopeptidase MepM/ murein hydrolase activator NlpD
MAAVLLGIALTAAPAGAQEARSTATPAHPSWVAVAADRVSAVVLEVLDEALDVALTADLVAAPEPPPPPPVTDPASWIWPADGPITSHFGQRWGRPHQGADIDGATGSAVIAPQAGTVTLAGWKNGYGQTVIIDHGHGITTLHAHLQHVAVAVGQVVPQGHYLGPVGATGNVTAAHLHYEVHVDGVPRNPVPWLQGPKAVPVPAPAPAPAPQPEPAPASEAAALEPTASPRFS